MTQLLKPGSIEARISGAKLSIWLLSGHNLALVNEAKAKVTGDPATIDYWGGVWRALERIIIEKIIEADEAGRKPAKKPKQKTTFNWQDRYLAAHRAYCEAETPNATKDHYALPKMPNVDSTNGLTTFVCNFLKWSGHFANRTGNEGRVITRGGKAIRIPSASKKGMQDIDTNLKHPAHLYGIPWKIEIKYAADTHKEHQKEFGKSVQQTGAHYSVVRSVEDFYNQFDKLMQ